MLSAGASEQVTRGRRGLRGTSVRNESGAIGSKVEEGNPWTLGFVVQQQKRAWILTRGQPN